MRISHCPECASSHFMTIEVEIRVQMSNRKNDFIEVRQEEVCCFFCNWVPSDHLKNVVVQRKITPPLQQTFRLN